MTESSDNDIICKECEAYSWGQIKTEQRPFLFGQPERKFRTITSGNKALIPDFNPDIGRIEGVRVFCKTCSEVPLIKEAVQLMDENRPFSQHVLTISLGNKFLWKKGVRKFGRPRYFRADTRLDQVQPDDQEWCSMCRQQTFGIGWYSDWKMSGVDPYWELMAVTVPSNDESGGTHRTVALRYAICGYCAEWMSRKYYEDEFGEPAKKKCRYDDDDDF